jgi:two-component system sensor histidine kinase YesM
VFSFIRPLRSIGDYVTRGWLSISLDEKVVSRIWSEPTPDRGEGSVLLLSREGIVLSSTDKTQLSRPVSVLYPGIERMWASSGPESVGSGSMTYGTGLGKKTILYVKEPMLGWTLVGITPYSVYSMQNRYILLLTAAAVALTVIANSGLILFLVRRVTNPLRTLAGLLTRLDPNEPLPLYPVTSSAEIGRLAHSYNKLGEHIEKLKAQLIRDETRKKEADMRALQAQINPHFLYNTLSSIHWIALMNDEKRIADMVGALSDFLRFSLNKGKEFCTVQQELAHIRNYVQVQSIRFPDKFDVDYAVDPSLQDQYMLKLLLQPLVENAMIHGVQKKEGRGHITVYVERMAGVMNFVVQDDGVGIEAERLAFIRSNLEADELVRSPDASYGLRNVHERLKLHYGKEAGLAIESRPQMGTRLSFTIPVREEERHAHHDRG